MRGAIHGVVFDEDGRIDLGVAAFAGVNVEEQLPERTLKTRESALQNNKSRTEIFDAASKSISPSASPISKCSFGLKARFGTFP